MPFVIKPIQPEDLDTIYPDSEAENIARFTHPKKFYRPFELGERWAVDKERGAFLTTLLQASRDNEMWRYIFGYKNAIALIKMEGNGEFSYMYVSPLLIQIRIEVEAVIREAFQISGLLIDEESVRDNLLCVPNAQFLPYVAKGE